MTNAQTSAHRRWTAAAGMVGPILFAATFTIEGWARPDYHPQTMYVSALSLGPRGWIQILNFVVFGALLIAFSRGVAAQFESGIASRAGPTLLAIIGFGILGSGPFSMDPMPTPPREMSAHGVIHQLLGAVVFSLMPAVCIVFYRRFRIDPAWRSYAGWSLTAGLVIVASVIALKVAQFGLPPRTPNLLTEQIGVVQRCALLTFQAWLFTFALGIDRRWRATGRVDP